MAIDQAEFRRAMGHFAAGVTVVTSKFEGANAGITVTAFTSLSLDPPLVIVCIQKTARMHPRLPLGGNMAVNMLTEEQELVSREFASSKTDPFLQFGHHEGATGAPILQDAMCAIECKIVSHLDGGDHTIVVGEVQATHVRDGKPLLYYRGGYAQLA
jgi:flavin reductase (DIM6/NTAB) family NADH-FMN oxidoreductase RutF